MHCASSKTIALAEGPGLNRQLRRPGTRSTLATKVNAASALRLPLARCLNDIEALRSAYFGQRTVTTTRW